MKKIGIITICKTDNYGAELQAFALLKGLQTMGYESELIDYLYYKNWNFKDTSRSASFIKMGLKARILYWLKYRFVNFLISEIVPIFNKSVRNRKRRFESFHKTNSVFSSCYNSIKKLYANPPIYDAYIVGSDQVWNPNASSSIEPYFLTFVPQNKKRISYASSFGVSDIDEDLYSRYQKLLNNIDEISVREQSGVDLVKKLINRKVSLTIDPTLLLKKEEWEKVEKSYAIDSEKYIIVYQLSENQTIKKMAAMVAKKKGLPIYRITKRAYGLRHDPHMLDIKDAGPAEFISLIAHAFCVVTDSFHGTAFSINLDVPFYSVLKRNGTKNARIESLLNLLNLRERIVYDNMMLEEIKEEQIDINNVQQQLEKLREESMSFLKNSIC